MGKRLPYTPNSRIRSALRQLWLRSRERAAALERTGNCCENCGIKQSRAKGREVYLEVHHLEGIGNWEKVIAVIREEILCDEEKLQVLCKACHVEIDENRHA